MARRNKETAAPAAAPPPPETYSPAAGYSPPPQAQPAGPGAYPGYSGYPGAPGAAANGTDAVVTAPPPRNTAPFVNAKFLWELQRPVKAIINKVRTASGGNAQYGNKKGWFLDCKLETGQECTARINEGDQRHVRLYAKNGPAWAGKSVVLRLSHPGDDTKAPWTLDAL